MYSVANRYNLMRNANVSYAMIFRLCHGWSAKISVVAPPSIRCFFSVSCVMLWFLSIPICIPLCSDYKYAMLMLNACVVKLSLLFQDKSVSGFISYALCAADEALRDANWLPSEDEKKERTVPSAFCASSFFFYICIILSCWGLVGPVSGSLDRRRDWKHLRHFRCIANDH